MTLVSWWLPLLFAVSIGLVTLPFQKKWYFITGSCDKTVNFLCHMFHLVALGYFLFLGTNSYFADSDYNEKVLVRSKYIETHKKMRKMGKHRYVSDGVRKNYYLHIVLKDGKEKAIPVSLSVYNKTKENEWKEISLKKGVLGFVMVEI